MKRKRGLLLLVSVVILAIVVGFGGCSDFTAEPTAEPTRESVAEATQEAVGPTREVEVTRAEAPVVLGAPFNYRLTEEGKQLLLKTGLWYQIEGMLKLYPFVDPELISGVAPNDRTPGFTLNKFILILGIQELSDIALEHKISLEVLIGVVTTGIQEIYYEWYGEFDK